MHTLSKPIVVVTGTDLLKEVKKHFNTESYEIRNELDWLHPLKQKEGLASLLKEAKLEGTKLLLVINTDNLIVHLNNGILLKEKGALELAQQYGYQDLLISYSEIELYELKDQTFSEVTAGEYGYEIQWMNKMLGNLMEQTHAIQTLNEI